MLTFTFTSSSSEDPISKPQVPVSIIIVFGGYGMDLLTWGCELSSLLQSSWSTLSSSWCRFFFNCAQLLAILFAGTCSNTIALVINFERADLCSNLPASCYFKTTAHVKGLHVYLIWGLSLRCAYSTLNIRMPESFAPAPVSRLFRSTSPGPRLSVFQYPPELWPFQRAINMTSMTVIIEAVACYLSWVCSLRWTWAACSAAVHV